MFWIIASLLGVVCGCGAEVVFIRSDAAYDAFVDAHAHDATIVLFDETHPSSLVHLNKMRKSFTKNSPGVVMAAVHAPDVPRFKESAIPQTFHIGSRRRLAERNIYSYGSVDLTTLPEHLLIFVNEHERDEVTKVVRQSSESSSIPHVVVSMEHHAKEIILVHFEVDRGPEHQAFRITRGDDPKHSDVVAQIKFQTAAEFVARRGALRLDSTIDV